MAPLSHGQPKIQDASRAAQQGVPATLTPAAIRRRICGNPVQGPRCLIEIIHFNEQANVVAPHNFAHFLIVHCKLLM
jgi:hypothetical protein